VKKGQLYQGLLIVFLSYFFAIGGCGSSSSNKAFTLEDISGSYVLVNFSWKDAYDSSWNFSEKDFNDLGIGWSGDMVLHSSGYFTGNYWDEITGAESVEGYMVLLDNNRARLTVDGETWISEISWKNPYLTYTERDPDGVWTERWKRIN
jgi:hypothetical protein